jgi:hypothetical protein
VWEIRTRKNADNAKETGDINRKKQRKIRMEVKERKGRIDWLNTDTHTQESQRVCEEKSRHNAGVNIKRVRREEEMMCEWEGRERKEKGEQKKCPIGGERKKKLGKKEGYSVANVPEKRAPLPSLSSQVRGWVGMGLGLVQRGRHRTFYGLTQRTHNGLITDGHVYYWESEKEKEDQHDLFTVYSAYSEQMIY